jgi:dTDP-4-dehydrorhamnose 3,5-epimerase
MTGLSASDIDNAVRTSVYTQDYSPKPKIDGVQILSLKNFVGENGDFTELMRLNDQGELVSVPGFRIRQINRSKQYHKAIKAWHLHFLQDEIWYVPPDEHLLLGLWDVREASATRDVTQKIPLGGGNSLAVYIPRGVAHGAANYSGKKANVYYFVNNQFNPDDPDEHRLPWDSKGADFWEAPKE